MFHQRTVKQEHNSADEQTAILPGCFFCVFRMKNVRVYVCISIGYTCIYIYHTVCNTEYIHTYIIYHVYI